MNYKINGIDYDVLEFTAEVEMITHAHQLVLLILVHLANLHGRSEIEIDGIKLEVIDDVA